VDKDAYGQRLTPESKQRLVENLQSAAFLKNSGLPGPPTFIIDSGNGIQALWRLDPQLSPTSENLHRIKQMNAFAIETTNGDKGTHNPVHLARLPGTTNIPSASKLKDGLVECQSKLLVSTGLVYPPSAFQQKEVLHLVAEGTSIIGAADPIESLDALLKWNVRESTKRIVVEGFDSEGKIEDDSPSGWQHKGVIELIEHGVPDAIIKGIITDEKWGISGSVLKERSREVDAYADRQIQRAHKSIEAYRRSEFPDDGVDLMEYGESESEEPQGESESDAPPKKPRRREHSLLESLEWVDPPFLIDGLIPYRGIGVIYGAPKSFKTFATSSIALHCAMGMDFYGQECRERVVVTYVAAEGGRVDFRNRCLAWCKLHRIDPAELEGWFYMCNTPVDLLDIKSLERFVRGLRGSQKRGLIVFDTLAKNSGTADENTKDTKAACWGANKVSRWISGTVILVHHEGKDSSRGARGSNVLLGDVDIAIRVVKKTEKGKTAKCLMTVEAARTIRDGQWWLFKPSDHVINDSLGEAMALEFLESKRPGEASAEESDEKPEPYRVKEPETVADFVVLKLHELQEGRTRQQLMTDGGWIKGTLYRAVKDLVKKGDVTINKKSGIVTLTEEGGGSARIMGGERRGEHAYKAPLDDEEIESH
jgi:hypothetical protein